ncbi:MAG: sigma-70 family RNA polymerase sigma factor [Roseburia sp.]|nr:sigma-70 family RNA polymerase sigma factor [Roseburia sp.]MCM1277993.1 sigma-70 family RNA polymerase sigma factor [Robinsoniella sp.]
MDDKALLHLLHTNGEAGIRAALDIYGNAVETICQNFLSDLSKEDVEEAIADTFIKLWQNSHSFNLEKGNSLKSYLYAIARNTSIDVLRKKQKALPIPFEEITIAAPDNIENDFIKKSMEDTLHQVLKSLKEPDRTIFILRYFYCEPIKNIALKMKCSTKKVENILFRGKSRLETALKERGVSHD